MHTRADFCYEKRIIFVCIFLYIYICIYIYIWPQRATPNRGSLLARHGSTQETPRKHPEGTQEAPRRHPGIIQEAPRGTRGGTQEAPRRHPGGTRGDQGTQDAPRSLGSKNVNTFQLQTNYSSVASSVQVQTFELFVSLGSSACFGRSLENNDLSVWRRDG